MKTAEEWNKQLRYTSGNPASIDNIKQIQLDAYKSGLDHAISVLRAHGEVHNTSMYDLIAPLENLNKTTTIETMGYL